MSKTEETVRAYIDRGSQLWDRAARENGLPPQSMSPSLFLEWLETLLLNLESASRRQYIAAVREWLSHLRKSGGALYFGSLNDLEQAIAKSHQMRSCQYTTRQKKKKSRANTSGQKAKKLDIREWVAVAQQAAHLRGKWISKALLWMAANMLVGLRPSEWRSVELIEDSAKLWLVVRNGKNTNGRAHGTFRHVDLAGLDKVELKMIRKQVSVVRQHAVDDLSWEQYYEGVRHTINRLARKFLPFRRQYPSLYSSRHQFAANAKSSGLSKVDIAAMMGHASDQTATEHYGKKRHGNGGCRVRPCQSEVHRVRCLTEKYTSVKPKC